MRDFCSLHLFSCQYHRHILLFYSTVDRWVLWPKNPNVLTQKSHSTFRPFGRFYLLRLFMYTVYSFVFFLNQNRTGSVTLCLMWCREQSNGCTCTAASSGEGDYVCVSPRYELSPRPKGHFKTKWLPCAFIFYGVITIYTKTKTAPCRQDQGFTEMSVKHS